MFVRRNNSEYVLVVFLSQKMMFYDKSNFLWKCTRLWKKENHIAFRQQWEEGNNDWWVCGLDTWALKDLGGLNHCSTYNLSFQTAQELSVCQVGVGTVASMNYLAFIQSKTDRRRGFKLKEGRVGFFERVLTGLSSGSWVSLAFSYRPRRQMSLQSRSVSKVLLIPAGGNSTNMQKAIFYY